MSGAPAVEYWADYICPWCYLALDRVDHLVARHGIVVTWRPFELHPEIPPDGGPLPRMTRARDTTDYLTAELAAAGLDVTARSTWSNSRRALALSVWASDRPEWAGLHRRLYEAYFVHGLDIGDPDVLSGSAVDAGLPAAEVRRALETGAGLADVAAARERALDLGIGATPGWHFGNGIVLAGAQPRSVFDRVVERNLRRDDR